MLSELVPTGDFPHGPEVLQLVGVHGWDLIVRVPGRHTEDLFISRAVNV